MHRDPVCIPLLHPIIFPGKMLRLYSIFKAAIFFLTFYCNIFSLSYILQYYLYLFISSDHFFLIFEGTNLALFIYLFICLFIYLCGFFYIVLFICFVCCLSFQLVFVSFYILKVLIHFIHFLLFYHRT